MLSKEEQKSLFEAEGQKVLEIDFWECKAGDVFRAKNKLGDTFLFELTVPISQRVNVYKITKGENLSSYDPFLGNYHLLYPVVMYKSTVFGEENTSRLIELKKVRSV